MIITTTPAHTGDYLLHANLEAGKGNFTGYICKLKISYQMHLSSKSQVS